MDWETVRAFVAVAREGTLTAAATQLGVNASTVHRRVAALEADLESRLFHKTQRGYLLTQAGEAALSHAIAAEESLLSLRRAVIGTDHEVRGRVRVTLPDTLLSTIAPLLSAFRATCPRVVLEVQASTALLDLRSDVDVALRIGIDPPDGAISRRLASVPWGRYRNANACADAPWIALGGMQRIPAVRDWQPGPGDAPAAFEVEGVADALAFLRSGPYQGLLPAYCGEASPALVRVGAWHPDRRTALWLLVHTDLRRSARVRAFVTDLRARFARATPPGLVC